MCHKWPQISVCRNHNHSRLITGLVTIVKRWAPHVEQELLTPPGHLSSPMFLCGIHIAQSFVFYVMFCRSPFALLSFFFWSLYCHCIVIVIVLSLYCHWIVIVLSLYCHCIVCNFSVYGL